MSKTWVTLQLMDMQYCILYINTVNTAKIVCFSLISDFIRIFYRYYWKMTGCKI